MKEFLKLTSKFAGWSCLAVAALVGTALLSSDSDDVRDAAWSLLIAALGVYLPALSWAIELPPPTDSGTVGR